MPLHKGLLKKSFALPTCEKHFHDHDEAWIVLSGRGTSYWIDHAGQRENFQLEEGDVWMIPAGFEHGTDGPNTPDFRINVFNGTLAPGCHDPKHYYVEKEGYIPSLQLVKTPTTRYQAAGSGASKGKVIMFVEKGRIELQEMEIPVCPPGHVLCQTLHSGLTNGTERNAMMGGNYSGDFPRKFGYQNVGRVISIGANAKGYETGDIVFSGAFNGHVGFFTVDTTSRDPFKSLVVKLSPSVDPRHAALFGMASVAVHDVRRGGVSLGNRVLVVGAGCIGQFTAQVARAAGAHVTICDLDETRLQSAKKLGAHQTINTGNKDAWTTLKAMGGFDVILEDSGAPILDKLIGSGWSDSLLKDHGKVVMVAGRENVSYSFNAGQSREIQILHVGHFQLADLQELHRLVSEGVVQMGPVIQDVVPIDQAVGIYERLRDKPNSLFGTVFDWGK